MRLSPAAGSGGVLAEDDDDVVAEGFELAAGVAGLAAAVGVPGMPAGSEVAVAGGGVAEQVPDDDQDGPADRAAGLLPPRLRRDAKRDGGTARPGTCRCSRRRRRPGRRCAWRRYCRALSSPGLCGVRAAARSG